MIRHDDLGLLQVVLEGDEQVIIKATNECEEILCTDYVVWIEDARS